MALGGVREQLGVRRAQEGPGVPSWDTVRPGLASVGPWQYQIARLGSTRYSTPPSTRYTTLPVPTQAPPSSVTPRVTTGSVSLGACTYDRFWRPEGDPRGVIRTGILRARQGCVWHCQPPNALALRPSPGACSAVISQIPSYISVISQFSLRYTLVSDTR